MLAAPRTIMAWRGRIRYRPATVFAALVRYYGGLIPATWIDDDFRRYRGPRRCSARRDL